MLIAATAVALLRTGRYPTLLVAISAGATGGLLATIAYDIVRLPFLAEGYRLFAPIDTYGILMTGASTSSPFTELLGWSYNFMNGIGFGIAFGMIALGRKWLWAIPFALALETTTIVTPYADVYGLRGKLDVIAIAYGAHLFFGAALGLVVERAGRWRDIRDSPIPAWWGLAATALVLIVANHPWTLASYLAPASALTPRPASVVHDGVFQPDWMRVPVGGCVLLDNRDAHPYRLNAPPQAPTLAAGSQQRYCFHKVGVSRVVLNGVPYSGGWVLVDPAE
ncbi:MAG: hypothetical protein ACR2MY_02325 [Candidatus Dormibacteria bacterium]